MLRICRIFLKLILRITLYQLLSMFLLLILYIVFVLWTEPLPEDESDSVFNVDTSDYRNIDPNIFYELKNDEIVLNVTKLVPESQYPIIVAYDDMFKGLTKPLQCPNNVICEIYDKGYRLRHDVGGAYLFYATNINFTNLPLPRQPENTFWAFLHEESPRNVNLFLHEAPLELFNFSSTYSRHSDVPFPLFQMESLQDITSRQFFVETAEKNSYLNELAPILYIQSDCETSTERDAYVSELMKYLTVDSYGKCLQNKPPLTFASEKDYLNNFKAEQYRRFIARYKFHIAIENGVCNDYVTEKFWRPIHLGSVPIYFGSPLIRDWLPNNQSAILIEDFPTPKILSEHIRLLMLNDSLYEEYLEHKTEGVISNQRLFEELRKRPYQIDTIETVNAFKCFVCKKLHEFRVKPEKHVVTKKHYDCPEPISVLSLDVNPENRWVYDYHRMKNISKHIYKFVSQANDSESYHKLLRTLPHLWLYNI